MRALVVHNACHGCSRRPLQSQRGSAPTYNRCVALSTNATAVEFRVLRAGVGRWINSDLDTPTMLGAGDPAVASLTVNARKVSLSAPPRYRSVPAPSIPPVLQAIKGCVHHLQVKGDARHGATWTNYSKVIWW